MTQKKKYNTILAGTDRLAKTAPRLTRKTQKQEDVGPLLGVVQLRDMLDCIDRSGLHTNFGD